MSGRKEGWTLSPRVWIPRNLNQGSLSVDLKEFELNGKPLPRADWSYLGERADLVNQMQSAFTQWERSING